MYVDQAHCCLPWDQRTDRLIPIKQARAAEAEAAQTADANGLTAQQEEEDKSRPVPTKVHIRGLDHFTTQDIRQFASEHYSTEHLQQRAVEWIDDTSANIVYTTEEAAAAALKAFTDLAESIPEQLSPLQPRRAKPLSTHPDTNLEVRLAIAGDVKAPRAHERSRFYLMNPEHDPRERRRDYDDRGRRGPGRRPDRRTREEPSQKFDVSMYDDDAGEEAGEVEPRQSRGRDRRPARSNNEDLFADKSQGRLRDRSASPVRDGDGRFGFDEDQPRRRTARHRSFSPPPRKRDLNQQSKASVELFPGKNKSSALSGPDTSAIESYPTIASPPRRNRELFPNRTPHSNHRRSDALDSEETQIARRKSTLPPVNATPSDITTGSLADRITGGPQPNGITLHSRPTNGSAVSSDFSIRGSATGDAPGFSIRGASREVNPVVKELFPSKLEAGNSAKEDLFADKMKGRNNQRRRAEDLF